jgi:PKD repeat protein
MFVVSGCDDDNVNLDGSMAPLDAGGGELGQGPDGGVPLRGAFSVVGCTSLTVSNDEPQCTGSAPLRLTFVPLLTGATTFVWTFTGGDPPTSQAITPSVLYARPGVYDVALAAGGPGGTLVSAGKIMVTAGGVGAPCSEDSDCDGVQGLTCLCGPGMAGCPGALGSGVCTRDCDASTCNGGEVCVDLERGLSAPMSLTDGGISDGGVPQPWRVPICLPSCTTSDDCRPGLICREVPGLPAFGVSGGPYTWNRACFADALGDDGDSCLSPAGAPDPSTCLSGRCDPFGARGLCTSPCDDFACPSAAACASLKVAPTQPLCLRRCDSTHPCNDPLLECAPPGQPGNLGFTVPASEPAGTTYCAPRRCDVDPTVCAPAGHCASMGAASYCVRN